MLKYVVFALVVTVAYSSYTVEQLAADLLKSNTYSGIEDYESALQFTSLMKQAVSTYNFSEARPSVIPFPCDPTGRSDQKPTNARRLLPGDIDLIIAMGDSLSAGFGADATSLFDLFIDYRGVSFSIGGQRTVDQVSTLANILRVYNPDLEGFSVGNGNANSANSRLNVAVSGARSYDLGDQVSNLLTKLESYDISAWKLLTLFIGGNDLCDSCGDPDGYSPANFRANVERILDAIKSQISNVFINVLVPPDVTLLSELSTGLCEILHPFECGCNDDPMTSLRQKDYAQALYSLVAQPKYHDQEDFYVVVQPFLQDIELPRKPDGTPDESYFAPDCFHFSTKSHDDAGLALWNNMMESLQNKKTEWAVGEPFECPVPGQYLR